MAVWSEVRNESFEKYDRLDAEFYQPIYLEVEERLNSVNAVRLESLLIDIRYGLNVEPDYVEEGVSFIRAMNLKEYGIEGEVLKIPYKAEDIGELNILENGDLLIVRSGANVGDIGIVTDDLAGSTFGSYVIRLKLNKEIVNPAFLYVFLKSKFGREQTVRFRSGTAQPNISIPNLKEVLVYLPSLDKQVEAEKYLTQSYLTKESSKTLYQEADELVLHKLGLDALDLSDELTYERNFDEVALAGRLDAQHFQPKYYRVLDAIKAIKPLHIVNLDALLEEITNGQTPLRHDLSIGNVRFLTAEHIHDFRINYDSDKRIETEHHENQLKKTQVKENDVLITIKGRIGNVAIVEDVPFPTNINQDVGLLRLKENIHPYYIAGFLNSQAGKALTEQVCTGQINPFLGLGNLRTVKIPILETVRMNALGEMIKAKINEATETQQSAKQLLEDAKRRVENMILGA
jgi:restriction endonuclease S subunit